MTIFKLDTMDHIGENWLVAELGADDDGKHYIITTDHVRASESWQYVRGAKADGELIVRLLNEHYSR